MQDFPGRFHVSRPDVYEAIDVFLDAQESHKAKALKLSDGKLAIGYDYPQNAIFIENMNGSQNNGLNGAPEQLLEAALKSVDLEAETAKIEKPLTGELARRDKLEPVWMP